MTETTPEAFASMWVREAAEPASVGERVCAAINRAAIQLDLPFGKVKRYWYAERQRLSAREYLDLERRIQALRGKREQREVLRAEIELLRRSVLDLGIGQDHGSAGQLDSAESQASLFARED